MSQDWLLAMAMGEREQNQGCNDDVYSPLKLNMNKYNNGDTKYNISSTWTGITPLPELWELSSWIGTWHNCTGLIKSSLSGKVSA